MRLDIIKKNILDFLKERFNLFRVWSSMKPELPAKIEINQINQDFALKNLINKKEKVCSQKKIKHEDTFTWRFNQELKKLPSIYAALRGEVAYDAVVKLSSYRQRAFKHH